LNKIITTIGKKNKEIQTQLEKLKSDTEERKKEVDGKNTAEIRMREGQHLQLMKHFGSLITDYQEMQAEYQKHYKDRMKRTVKITNPDLTEDEVEKLMTNNQIDEDAYKKKILTKSQQGTINAYYDEAVETRRDILMLEASLIELQDMFITMAQLVAQQDDLIDNIENNVMSADEYVKKATADIVVAQGHQEKSKWVLYAIIIAVIVLVIIGIILIMILGGGTIGGILGGLFGTGTIKI
jgi:t-SNARE complex subunit (syntaxin)